MFISFGVAKSDNIKRHQLYTGLPKYLCKGVRCLGLEVPSDDLDDKKYGRNPDSTFDGNLENGNGKEPHDVHHLEEVIPDRYEKTQ
jgi:hypothetical protein